MNARLRRAPFAAEIEHLLKIAPRCSWRLFASGADAERWRRAQRWIVRGYHAASVLPAGCDPAALRWPPSSVIADISGQSGALVERLVQALLRDGVDHALLIDTIDPARSFHCKMLAPGMAA